MRTLFPILAAAALGACVSLDGPTGDKHFTVEYDSRTGSIQEASTAAARQCNWAGKRPALVGDRPKRYDIRKRAAVFQCR